VNKKKTDTVHMLEGFNFLYTNADSLANKMDELKARIQEDKEDIDIIVITEVAPKNARYNLTQAEIGINGFNCFYDEECKRGVAIYVRNSINAMRVHIDSLFNEHLWIKCNVSRTDKLRIGAIYRSPNSCEENNKALNELFSEKLTATDYSHVVVLGDFNFPSIQWPEGICRGPSEPKRFIESIRDSFLYQHVASPTRARTDANPSVLDLVFTNEENMIDNIEHESPLGHSDHCVLKFHFKCRSSQTENTAEKWNHFKGDYESMRKELDLDWKEIFKDQDTNNMWNSFVNILDGLKTKYIPKKKQLSRDKAKKHKYVPMDQKTVRKIKKKHRLWQRYMESKDGEKYVQYTRARNQVKGLVRKAKREMEKDIARNAKTNPKKFWQYANSKRKVMSGIADLKYKEGEETKVADDDKSKANILADFFSSVFTKEPEGDIPEIDPVHLEFAAEKLIITEENIEKLLQELDTNKSPGPDDIHPYMLKSLATCLKKPLLMIFQSSIDNGTVPQQWKRGNVSAIFKKGDKADPGNYRPVSLTSVVCKLLEKIIRGNLLDHMFKNDLVSDKQYGFLPGRSTTIQLLHVMDEWTKILDEGGQVDAIYMDFMKAFDKVPHKRLLGKLNSYGFHEQAQKWVEQFLSDRIQEVRVKGEKSSSRQVTSGVLGPILFVIYINDKPQEVKNKIYLFQKPHSNPSEQSQLHNGPN